MPNSDSKTLPIYHELWARTIRGTPIDLYRKNHREQGKNTTGKTILFIGGVHGDEPEGVRMALDLLAHLSAEKKPQEFCNWTLIPCINPDGYLLNHRTNSQGVDLNRNFKTRDWSQESKAPRYFPGSAPGSELETQVLSKLITDEKPDLIVHFHSWEPSVVYTGEPGKPWAEILAKNAGYQAQADIGYPTPGSLGQFGWLEHQIPVICIEAQEKSNLTEIWPKWGQGLMELCRTFK